MPRKVVKKEAHATSEHKEAHVDKLLADNFVALQKAMTNLAVKFDSLSDQMSKLLQLFEISAKSFVEKQKEGRLSGENNEVLSEKFDDLIDQNKAIARGLSALIDKIDYMYGEPEEGYPEEYYEEPKEQFEQQAPQMQQPQRPMMYPPRGMPQQQMPQQQMRPSQIHNREPKQPYTQEISRAVTQEPQEPSMPAKEKSRIDELRERLRPKPLPRY